MASVETFLASPIEWAVRATGTNATVTASKAAPGAGFRHYVYGVSISYNAPPVTAAEAQVRKDSGGTILDGWLLSTTTAIPQFFNYATHPLEGSDNGDVDLNIPALGGGVSAVAVIKGTTRSRG
jgi:hypothetical protein